MEKPVQTHWMPPGDDGIRTRSTETTNEKIDDRTREALAHVEDSPTAIRERLAALDREWNIDRALMLNFAIAGSISSGLAMWTLYKQRRFGGWGALFATQLAFLAHHAIRRWCPPMAVLRRLGFRSDREISAERSALEERLHELEPSVS